MKFVDNVKENDVLIYLLIKFGRRFLGYPALARATILHTGKAAIAPPQNAISYSERQIRKAFKLASLVFQPHIVRFSFLRRAHLLPW